MVRAITIRTSEDQRVLIDRAAKLSGKSGSDFMVESATMEVERARLDRMFFALDEDAFARFESMLEAPVQASDDLCVLLHAKASAVSAISQSGILLDIAGSFRYF